MAAPKRFQETDYSPTQVAKLGLLNMGRSAIYNKIHSGEIETILDDHGRERITAREIERLRADEQKRKQSDPDAWCRAQRRRELARAAAFANIAQHGREEVARRKAAGTLASYERRADPEGILTPEDRLERARALWAQSAAYARAKKAEIAEFTKKYGRQQS